VRSELIGHVLRSIKARRLTHSEAARSMRISKSRLRLVCGRIEGLDIDALVTCWAAWWTCGRMTRRGAGPGRVNTPRRRACRRSSHPPVNRRPPRSDPSCACSGSLRCLGPETVADVRVTSQLRVRTIGSGLQARGWSIRAQRTRSTRRDRIAARSSVVPEDGEDLCMVASWSVTRPGPAPPACHFDPHRAPRRPSS